MLQTELGMEVTWFVLSIHQPTWNKSQLRRSVRRYYVNLFAMGRTLLSDMMYCNVVLPCNVTFRRKKNKNSFSTKYIYKDIFVWKEENGNSNMEIFDLLPIFSIFLPSYQFEMLHGKRHGSSMSVFGLKWRGLTRNMRFDVLQRHVPSSSRRCGR